MSAATPAPLRAAVRTGTPCALSLRATRAPVLPVAPRTRVWWPLGVSMLGFLVEWAMR